jgi:hypothetical protein
LPYDVFADDDGDGYGDAWNATTGVCETPSGFVEDDTDCDDNDAFVNPGEAEDPYNGIDDDCDAGTPDDDLDGDGYGIADDCDDDDAAVNPGAVEVTGNGVDDDCDASTSDVAVTQSWNPAADYDGSNGGGVWSYGFTRHNVPWQAVTHHGTYGILDWWNWGNHFYLMQVYTNTSATTVYGNCADWCLQPGTIAIHPSSDSAVTSGIRFTAPQAGDYDVDVTFKPIDAQSNYMSPRVRVNGTYVHVGTLTTLGTTSSYSGTVTLAAGDTVDFLINNAGTWVNDGTDVDANITLN